MMLIKTVKMSQRIVNHVERINETQSTTNTTWITTEILDKTRGPNHGKTTCSGPSYLNYYDGA